MENEFSWYSWVCSSFWSEKNGKSGHDETDNFESEFRLEVLLEIISFKLCWLNVIQFWLFSTRSELSWKVIEATGWPLKARLAEFFSLTSVESFRSEFGANAKASFPNADEHFIGRVKPQISNFPDGITCTIFFGLFSVRWYALQMIMVQSVYEPFDAWYIFRVKFKLWIFFVFFLFTQSNWQDFSVPKVVIYSII